MYKGTLLKKLQQNSKRWTLSTPETHWIVNLCFHEYLIPDSKLKKLGISCRFSNFWITLCIMCGCVKTNVFLKRM
jgi:hypothetical protein